MNIKEELARLGRLTTGELAGRYIEVCGEPARTRNRAYLTRKIAWRLQAQAEGDLSERARRRAMELANDADLRLSAPRNGKPVEPANPIVTDTWLPAPGNSITRKYKRRVVNVNVLDNGFEYQGERYKSLSAVAKAITGSHRRRRLHGRQHGPPGTEAPAGPHRSQEDRRGGRVQSRSPEPEPA
jgi:hypothetical protein